jgi:arginyl-tRNA synthetase
VKDQLIAAIEQALEQLQIPLPAKGIVIERTRDAAHGDLASNIALVSAKAAGKNPRELASALVEKLEGAAGITKMEIAGPGFINFFLSSDAATQVIKDALSQGQAFGRNQSAHGQRVQIEYVSANPTGPLHVGHGRGAAYGASLANVLAANGWDVHREYYVNDAGRQMNILAASVWLRYLEACGEAITFPVNGYKGEYIKDYAAELKAEHGERFSKPAAEVMAELPADFNEADESGDKEAHIDALIERAQSLLGKEDYEAVFAKGLNGILGDIRQDLAEFGVEYDEWFSERSLTDNGDVNKAIDVLKSNQHIYEKDGALWFKSEALGDEKDRCVVRDNGVGTYFASDIAYHQNKCERGFDRIVDIWGADHHGYIARVKAAMQALGQPVEKLDVRLVQFAVLYRGKEKVQMSTRSGQFVTLRELREEVGNDAARFFYVLRSSDQHLDFDLELAKSQSNDNPVYYIQYAHARVCQIFGNKMAEKGYQHDANNGLAQLSLLTEPQEAAVIDRLAAYPDMVAAAGRNCAPHSIAHYLRDLAADFHSWYNAHAFVIEEADLRDARLCLALAVKQTIANGLALLGVNAPERM